MDNTQVLSVPRHDLFGCGPVAIAVVSLSWLFTYRIKDYFVEIGVGFCSNVVSTFKLFFASMKPVFKFKMYGKTFVLDEPPPRTQTQSKVCQISKVFQISKVCQISKVLQISIHTKMKAPPHGSYFLFSN